MPALAWMYSFNRDATTKTSCGTSARFVDPAAELSETIRRVPLDISAFISMAAASLWRALGRWTSKHGTLQKTYPVRWPLQVETLQT